MNAEQRRSRRRARAGYWRIYRRRRGISACNCEAWHFPHRKGSCAAGERRHEASFVAWWENFVEACA